MDLPYARWVTVTVLLVLVAGTGGCPGRADDPLTEEGNGPGPCLKGTPPGICTAQLVEGGVRYVIGDHKVKYMKPPDDKEYAFDVCCNGRIFKVPPRSQY